MSTPTKPKSAKNTGAKSAKTVEKKATKPEKVAKPAAKASTAKAKTTSGAKVASAAKKPAVTKAPALKSRVATKAEIKAQAKQDKKAVKRYKKAQKLARLAELEPSKLKTGIIASIVAVVVLVISGIGIGIWTSSQNNQPAEEIAEEEVIEEEPEEELPEENPDELQEEPEQVNTYTYQVAAYKPKYLSIPALSLYNIPVVEIGVEASGALGSPASDRVVGWYYGSDLPGVAGGTALMNAHGGALGTGIFKTLPNIRVGNEIIVEMGDGRKFTYVVADSVFKKLGAESDGYMRAIQVSPQPGVASLSLITCTGTWMPEKRTYDQRQFVRAVLRG